MNKVLVALACVFGFAIACGTSSGNNGRGGPTFTTDAGHADAGSHDAGGTQDAGSTDAGNNTQLYCPDILSCVNNCADSACRQDCFNRGYPNSQGLFQTAVNCLAQACPSGSGQVCETQSSACDQCYQTNAASNGACGSDVAACDNDGPGGNTDGGSSGTGCYGIILCSRNCTTQQCLQNCYSMADTQGQGIFQTLNNCLVQNCPSTTGGPCATQPSTSCSNCLQSVQATNGACNSDLVACQQDQ